MKEQPEQQQQQKSIAFSSKFEDIIEEDVQQNKFKLKNKNVRQILRTDKLNIALQHPISLLI